MSVIFVLIGVFLTYKFFEMLSVTLKSEKVSPAKLRESTVGFDDHLITDREFFEDDMRNE